MKMRAFFLTIIVCVSAAGFCVTALARAGCPYSKQQVVQALQSVAPPSNPTQRARDFKYIVDQTKERKVDFRLTPEIEKELRAHGATTKVIAAVRESYKPGSPEEKACDPTVNALAVWERAFVVNGQRIAYASPDNVYEVIQERLNGARESILIGMYDFTAAHVKDLLLSALGRGVKVSLLIDYSRDPNSGEPAILDELTGKGAVVVKSAGPFPAYHAKVIVIDRTWTLVQSGNFTVNSVPQKPEVGNRDMGVALESGELAGYFTGLLEDDIKRARRRQGDGGNPFERETTYAAYIHVPRFAPLRIDGTKTENQNTGGQTQPSAPPRIVRALPLLSPDNYMEVLPQVLASARESVDIEQQYVKAASPNVRKLFDAIEVARRRNPNLRVRIVLARPLGLYNTTLREWDILRASYGLRFGDNVRILNRRSGMNCTNRLVIVDGKVSLVGSTNWSQQGTTKNREVSLLIDSGDIAGYYARIFQADWDAGLNPADEDD